MTRACRCGVTFDVNPQERRRRVWCTDSCRIRHRRRASPGYARSTYVPRAATKWCANCGSPVRDSPRVKFCTGNVRCRRLAGAERKRRHDQRVKARKVGAVVEAFDPHLVFERSGWVCGLCGRPVNPDVSSLHRLGPVLDYVVPLSDGGSHSLDNVRLAHSVCAARRT